MLCDTIHTWFLRTNVLREDIMKNTQLKLKLQLLLVMAIFGIMGPIVRAIGLPSPVIACLRGWIAGIVLVLFLVISGHEFDRRQVKKAFIPMALCGFYMAVDWIGLFEAYNYTTIATATVCYYMTPIFVFLASPIILKEKFTAKHVICSLIAFVGMVFVSGVMDAGGVSGDLSSNIKGILFALLGAVGYSAIILTNKKHPKGDPIVRTAIQLLVAGILTTPYVFLRYDVSELSFTPKGIALLLLLSVAFTAAVYIRYFSIIVKIPARAVAILSYMDPVVAVFVSVAVMGEKITVWGILGTVMIIGAALASELQPSSK